MTDPTHHTLDADPVVFSMSDPGMQAPMPAGFSAPKPDAVEEADVDVAGDRDDGAVDPKSAPPSAEPDAPSVVEDVDAQTEASDDEPLSAPETE